VVCCHAIPKWYSRCVDVLGVGALTKFKRKHSQAKPCLNHWLQVTGAARWASIAGVMITFNSASYVQPFVVFNLCGNKYRLVVLIDFVTGIVQVDEMLTHKEYDRWTERRR
jgi:mRNA interferase HigB